MEYSKSYLDNLDKTSVELLKKIETCDENIVKCNENIRKKTKVLLLFLIPTILLGTLAFYDFYVFLLVELFNIMIYARISVEYGGTFIQNISKRKESIKIRDESLNKLKEIDRTLINERYKLYKKDINSKRYQAKKEEVFYAFCGNEFIEYENIKVKKLVR